MISGFGGYRVLSPAQLISFKNILHTVWMIVLEKHRVCDSKTEIKKKRQNRGALLAYSLLPSFQCMVSQALLKPYIFSTFHRTWKKIINKEKGLLFHHVSNLPTFMLTNAKMALSLSMKRSTTNSLKEISALILYKDCPGCCYIT